ncbi:MAG: hypothetical protein WC843_06535 [Candidatus Gracilibacteria bacterium]|jgi:hypothetical protein
MTSIEYLRQFKVLDYAIFDLVLSFVGIYLLAPLLSKIFLKLRLKISKKSWMFLTLPISILVHIMVGTMTPMTKYFLDIQDHYILKIIILGLLALGIKDIKIVPKKT